MLQGRDIWSIEGSGKLVQLVAAVCKTSKSVDTKRESVDVIHFHRRGQEKREEVAPEDEWDDRDADATHAHEDPDGNDKACDAQAEPGRYIYHLYQV